MGFAISDCEKEDNKENEQRRGRLIEVLHLVFNGVQSVLNE